ncbi:MAG: DUF4251 domain-containing protein [Alistipes sp.]|nr:DUF4251 domain-containing protein [Alistipes sp.]
MKHLIVLALAVAGFCSCASNRGLTKEERRMKSEEYCEYMDSLVRSHVYSFKPQFMQIQPAGRRMQISNVNYRMNVYDEYIDLNLPYLSGLMAPYRRTMLNYTLSNVGEYKAEQSQDGQYWTITFTDTLFSATNYHFKLTVRVCTGDATLEISAVNNTTVSYTGFMTKIY